MKATTWRGAPETLPASAKKKRKKKAPAPRGFMCGCGGTGSSVSVDISAVTTAPVKRDDVSTAAASAGEPASKTTVGCGRDTDDDASAEGTPSVDSLLRQLRELERGVRALGVREREEDGDGGSSSSAAGTTTTKETARPPLRPGHARSASVVGRLDSESVAVVTESADPLGDFRRSMAQMILENGITGGAELRELLRRFLALNAACHHHLILRAFADVWEELFAAAGHAAPSRGSGGRASKRPRGRADTLS
ncbi:unnamed protein product [Miscanthus lutarioriparius]|uniref:Transcription repressor n=1 Tax=Miscanthus lutarioriparius TaxID=422564 RepID=A0A811MNY2_9POAL|nr:unnamed protein product [Miscanthus lutarioriparius]